MFTPRISNLLNSTPAAAQAVALLSASAMLGSAAFAEALPESPEFIIHTPDTTGMPGQNAVTYATLAPNGDVWIGANNSGLVWQFGGVGIYNGDTWTTYSSRNTPVPMWTYGVDWDLAGRAWIAGEDRVVVSDGSSWIVFDPSNSPLVGDRNWAVAIAPNGHVWIANDDINQVQGGLFEYDGSAWTHHVEPFMQTYFGSAVPFGVYARSNGEIWAAFQLMGGMARFAGGVWTRQSGPTILDFAEGPDGTLYGVNGLGTYRYNDATLSWTQIGPYTSSNMACDAQGRIYVGNSDGVYRLDGSTWSFFAAAPSDVRSIDIAPNGDVWVAYEHSVRQYSSAGEGLRIYSSVMTGVPEFVLDNIVRDNDGNMWLCTGEAGASRFDGTYYRNFSQFGHEETNPFQVGTSLLCEHVSDVFQDSQGNIWFAANGVARSADLESWDLWYFGNSSIWSGGMRAIGEDVNGTIWAGSDGVGIYWFDGEDWQLHALGTTFNGQRVREIVTATDGVMWVATYAAVHSYDGQTWTMHPISGPRDIAAGVNGDVWVATTSGLRHLQDGTSTLYGPHNTPMDFSNVSSVTVRSDGLVAVSTEEGQIWPYDGDVSLFDGESWASFDYGSSDNPFWQTKALEFDADGDLWAAQVNFGGVEIRLDQPQGPAADLNGDGVVNGLDLGILLANWSIPATAPGCSGATPCASDLNGDGFVNGLDLGILLASWS